MWVMVIASTSLRFVTIIFVVVAKVG
jgi:hypothetical protein